MNATPFPAARGRAFAAGGRSRRAAALLISAALLAPAAGAWGQGEEGAPAAGGEAPPAAARRWGGFLQSALRVDPQEAPPGLRGWELRLALQAQAQVSESARLSAEVWLRSLSFPPAAGPADLSSPQALDPLDLEIREAYFDLYGFPLPSMDLRLGRQRLAWGRADRISVVDNLNPDDLEDPWDFGRHLGSDAASLTTYLAGASLQLVYLPFFRPARLPAGGSFLAAAEAAGDESAMTIELPGRGLLEGASFGVRLSVPLAGWDLAASYLYGRDDLPLAAETVVSATDPSPPPVTQVDVRLAYARLQVASLDLAGELLGLGVWAEAAGFFPDARQVTDLTGIGGARTAETLAPYCKAVVGLDYTFPGGLYASLQAAHGLFFENRSGGIHDYLLAGLEWKVFHDRLKIGPLGVALEVDNLRRPAGSWALALTPEVGLYPADGAELAVGLHWVEGRAGTTLGGRKADREVYVRGRFSF